MDPAIYNELETLRNIKLNLEAECNGLGSQLTSQNDELNSLKMTLNQRNHEVEELKNSLKGALDKSKKMADTMANMEKNNSSKSGQFEVTKFLRSLCMLFHLRHAHAPECQRDNASLFLLSSSSYEDLLATPRQQIMNA